jgi:hypothetical protein
MMVLALGIEGIELTELTAAPTTRRGQETHVNQENLDSVSFCLLSFLIFRPTPSVDRDFVNERIGDLHTSSDVTTLFSPHQRLDVG